MYQVLQLLRGGVGVQCYGHSHRLGVMVSERLRNLGCKSWCKSYVR